MEPNEGTKIGNFCINITRVSAFLPTTPAPCLLGDPMLLLGNTLHFQKTQKLLPTCLKLSQLVSLCLQFWLPHLPCVVAVPNGWWICFSICKIHLTVLSKAKEAHFLRLPLRMCSDNFCPDASMQMHISDFFFPD